MQKLRKSKASCAEFKVAILQNYIPPEKNLEVHAIEARGT